MNRNILYLGSAIMGVLGIFLTLTQTPDGGSWIANSLVLLWMGTASNG